MSKRIRRAAALAAALVVAVAACAADDLAPSLSPQQLQDRLGSSDAPLVLDVRTPEEYAAGHIPGAVNVPYEQVASRAAELASPNGVAVYCMKGPRARIGEQALLASGASGVVHLDGGFLAWQTAGLPVAK